MFCIGIAILMLAASCITTMRLTLYSMNNLGQSYKSNSELNNFSQAVTNTEKAMEAYISYRTFESIDTYYNSRTKVEDYYKDSGFNNMNTMTNEFQAPQFYEKCGFELEFVRKNKDNPKLNKYYYVKYF